ncbi:hypothetical protein E2C01_081345 [Portunus trituberculatus]|uniref:Uncharacterized protein n=1 Tax=Portunus trituberculatus TaxID=210409 RepID=A0A5B7IXR3_PORTR|nr:hypothetical protein [Portunus trituberculatus]
MILMFSSRSRNWSATDTFSSFWLLKVGRLLCLGRCLPDSTSMRAMRRRPSLRSVSRLPMCLDTCLRCSLAHRVNVFCWILFHCASSANSRSVAAISSSSSPAWQYSGAPGPYILNTPEPPAAAAAAAVTGGRGLAGRGGASLLSPPTPHTHFPPNSNC